jgi:RalA-binding protein 1
MLVRYVMGSYNEEPVFAFGPNPAATNDHVGSAAPRSSTSSTTPSDHHGLSTGNSRRPLVRGMPRDEMMKTTQLPSIQTGNDVSPTKAIDDHGEHSPARSMDPSPIDRQGPGGFANIHIAKKLLERGQHPAPHHDSFPLSSSLPSTSSPLDNVNGSLVPTGQRSNSELGHYTDAAGYGHHQQDHFAEQYRRQDHYGDMSAFLSATSFPNLSLPTDLRASSPEKVEVNGKAKISAPIGGAPIPAGYKFGGKDPSPDPAATASERREKAKSRSFWGFGRPGIFLVLSSFPLCS